MTHVSSMLDYVLQIIWSCLSLFVYISKHMSRLQMAAEEFSLPIYHPSEATEGKQWYRWTSCLCGVGQLIIWIKLMVQMKNWKSSMEDKNIDSSQTLKQVSFFVLI